MAKEAFDRHLCSRAILPEFVLEIINGFVHVVAVGRVASVPSHLDGLSDGDPLSVHSEERRILL